MRSAKNSLIQRLLALVLLLSMQGLLAEETLRQAEVAKRGAQVMPFELEKTQHQFSKTETGGIQRVVVRDANDVAQIQLIRQHLQQLAEKFKVGDYSGPESIHGADMPGLATLKKAKADDIQIAYKPEPQGASITFTAQKPEWVAAIHTWFDAQLHDHGHDAMLMHHQHHMQP
ncbi:aspartate carbamoyltransferase [Methylomonas sp. AM2-LC]|uniref:aspartate carbamoyltransferase n=1 Tax=Methylomonas sp. AM2-LC TaxID=3153301 RepID=UPI0032662697